MRGHLHTKIALEFALLTYLHHEDNGFAVLQNDSEGDFVVVTNDLRDYLKRSSVFALGYLKIFNVNIER